MRFVAIVRRLLTLATWQPHHIQLDMLDDKQVLHLLFAGNRMEHVVDMLVVDLVDVVSMRNC
jgi:hypothetical protein